MTIAAAAYDQLKPETKRRVAELIALSRYPTNGTNNASPDNAAKAAMMMTTTSVDAIKKGKNGERARIRGPAAGRRHSGRTDGPALPASCGST
jgi:hypothetical protein